MRLIIQILNTGYQIFIAQVATVVGGWLEESGVVGIAEAEAEVELVVAGLVVGIAETVVVLVQIEVQVVGLDGVVEAFVDVA